MSLRVSFELEDSDLKHFRLIMREARKAAAGVGPEDIVAAAEDLLRLLRDTNRVLGLGIDDECTDYCIEIIDLIWFKSFRLTGSVFRLETCHRFTAPFTICFVIYMIKHSHDVPPCLFPKTILNGCKHVKRKMKLIYRLPEYTTHN